MDQHELELSELYATYFRAICLYIRAKTACDLYEAEDLASDVFFILQLKWNAIRPRTAAVLATWLYRTADNLLRDRRKRSTRSPTIVDLASLEATLSVHGQDEIEHMLQRDDLRRLLRRIKRELSPEDWALFVARYIDERSTEEMCAKFETKPSPLYLRISRLKGRLKKICRAEP